MQNDFVNTMTTDGGMPAMQKVRKLFTVKTMPYWMILPACLLLAGVVLFPILRVFAYSLMDYSSLSIEEPAFIGLDNFVKLFTKDRVFKTALKNSARWVAWEVSLQLVIGCFAALALNQTFHGRSIARSLTLIPWAVSGVLTAILWSLMYNEHVGVLNDLLMRLGIITRKKAWLGDFSLVFPSVVVAELWRGIPFFAISLLAALQSISTDLYEAARIDGANYPQQLRYVVLPHLKDTILLTTLLRVVWEFNNVDVIFNLTGGGPANRTMTLSMYLSQQAIKSGEFGFGSSIAIFNFCILAVFAVCYLKLGRFTEEN